MCKGVVPTIPNNISVARQKLLVLHCIALHCRLLLLAACETSVASGTFSQQLRYTVDVQAQSYVAGICLISVDTSGDASPCIRAK